MPNDADKLTPASILPLRYWDDPILSKVCDKVEDNEFGPKLEEFGRELVATMDDRNGVGLAAPQVGVAKRMFAMHYGQSVIVLANPMISPYGDVVGHNEGCLSVPGLHVWIERQRQVAVRYQKLLTGVWAELDLADIESFCAQHELDHCDGIMMFDRRRVTRQIHRQALREWEKMK